MTPRGARQTPEDGVLPVRRMHYELRYVVAVSRRAPGGLVSGNSSDGAAQVCAVPGLAIVSCVEDRDEQPDFRVHVTQ